jgi:hypothetical protein
MPLSAATRSSRPSPAERAERGKAARGDASRRSHGAWEPAARAVAEGRARGDLPRRALGAGAGVALAASVATALPIRAPRRDGVAVVPGEVAVDGA